MDYIVRFLTTLSKYAPSTRSIVKTLLRSITGKCELERLCSSGKYGYDECTEIEYSLYSSKNPEVQKILVADTMKVKDAMQNILRIKRIIPGEELFFLSSMPKFLRKIISYNALLTEVSILCRTNYDENNVEHEKLLKHLWELIKGKDDKLEERDTFRWKEIGFQGTNPATDFRSMGILSLKNLLFLLEEDEKTGMKIFGQSQHPNYGFSFAIMGIDFTSASFDLLRSGKLKGYMYNLDENEYTLQLYQGFFVKLFNEFVDYWIMCKPPNIMYFGELRKKFMEDVSKRLSAGKW